MQIINKKFPIICLLCLFLFPFPFPFIASAQQALNMGGVVSDEGGPLPGVNIYLKGRISIGTTTNTDGTFKIRASKGDVIVFAFIGYNTVEYLVDQEDGNIQVMMTAASTEIEEVVVTALGTQRKVSVVGAITSVDTKELQTPATSMANMLGGRVAGMITTMDSGEPGKNIAEFWIRGIGTFGANSSALVLIDGLEGDLSSLDPADVESFSILKDASATAVYGVRGANGVVLVTTKRGQSGRLKITARANYTLSYLNRMPEYLRAYDYARLANEARTVRDEEILYNAAEMKIIQHRLDPDLYPDIDWQKEIIKRNGFQQTYYMSAQGGGEVARYFVSLGASIEDAAYKIAPENTVRTAVGYNTYNFRMNLDINLTKNTTLYFGTDGFLSMRKEPGFADTDAMWATQSMLTPITVPIRYSTGELPAYSSGFGGSGISPYVILNYTGRQTRQNYTGKQTIAITHDFSDWVENLKLKVQGAYDNISWKDERRYVLPDLYLATGRTVWADLQLSRSLDAVSPRYSKYTRQSRKFHLESTVTWDKVIATDHRISALLYYYMSDSQDTKDADDAGIGRVALEALPKRYQGLSSRLTYGFKDTYMIDVNFGYTGSENFEPGKQFGFFPSVAVGWVPTNYQWAKDHVGWLHHLKIRASYGTVGNDRLSDFRFPFMTIISENQPTGWGSTLNGVVESQFGANNLMWERALKANVGIEGRMFKDRLSFVVDFFNDKRESIFQRRETIPGHVGLVWSARPYGNVGSMHSYGTDGNISFLQEINKDWSFTVRGNYTYSQNEILYWEEPPTPYPYQLRKGYPNSAIRGYIATGLFADEDDVAYSAVQSFGGFKVMPGDIKYKDVNGDGVINSDDQVYLSDPTYPRLMYGFGGELKYKNFTLGILFKGTGKTTFYHVGYYHYPYGTNGPGYVPFNDGRIGNVLATVNDPANRWVPKDYAIANGIDPSKAENPNARFPRLSYGYNANNSQLSTFWKNDSRYLRLQEVTLNYNLRGDFVKRIGLSSADIQFVGSNLYVWDRIKDWDPEQGYRNGRAYPIPSRYALQIYLNF
ncbi:MAG: TonB-dependent receptor [Bacteroidales bacterium]|jgi:TonB-linked SusC/RagA family outer membrane protein|nr:TonB-dependent receptor [Bacteroidales bacterium]